MLTVACEKCGTTQDAVKGSSRGGCPVCQSLFTGACVELLLPITWDAGPGDDDPDPDDDDPDTDLYTDDGGAVPEQILAAMRTGYGMGLGGFDCDSQEGE